MLDHICEKPDDLVWSPSNPEPKFLTSGIFFLASLNLAGFEIDMNILISTFAEHLFEFFRACSDATPLHDIPAVNHSIKEHISYFCSIDQIICNERKPGRHIDFGVVNSLPELINVLPCIIFHPFLRLWFTLNQPLWQQKRGLWWQLSASSPLACQLVSCLPVSSLVLLTTVICLQGKKSKLFSQQNFESWPSCIEHRTCQPCIHTLRTTFQRLREQH